jgi:hypothetical protein
MRPLDACLLLALFPACTPDTAECEDGGAVEGASFGVEEEHRDTSGTAMYGYLDAVFASRQWNTADLFHEDEELSTLDLPDCTVPTVTARGGDGFDLELWKRRGAGYLGTFEPSDAAGDDFSFTVPEAGALPTIDVAAGPLPTLVPVDAEIQAGSDDIVATWAPGSAADLLWLALTHIENGSRVLFQVVDDGEFIVPATRLDAWEPGSILVGLSNSALGFEEVGAVAVNSMRTSSYVIELDR